MTATVPDLGQFIEVREAARLSRSTEPDVAAYYTGVMVGFTASFCSDDTFMDALTDARRHHYAEAYDIANAGGRWQLLGRNADPEGWTAYLRACGILFGFKDGTSERPDAEECSLCEGRILTSTDDEHEHCTSHGFFCNESCRRSTCTARCFRRDL